MMSKKHTILVVEDEPSMVTLIISDIGMPEIDGFELRQLLLNDEKLRRIPFIFLTAKTRGEDQFRSMRLGVSHFLTKPFEPELLLLTVKDIFSTPE
jgi:CheY-like chemotaxis protein